MNEKIIAEAIHNKTGRSVYTATVKRLGNASYRVFLNGSAVAKVFSSETEATEYAVFCVNQASNFLRSTHVDIA